MLEIIVRAAILKLSSFSRKIAIFGLLAVGLAACQDQSLSVSESRAFAPIPAETLALMTKAGTTPEAPMMIRAFKKESVFEIWKMKASGRYTLLKSYPMCRWSGQLGPKKREGDRQVPEGFYQITPGQMNPNSHYYLSFNVGYPNAYDRAWGRRGGAIMVHGICSSAGCFSMTNPQIGEIYALAREAFAGGQKAIEMQTFPFKMTPKNLAKFRLDPNMPFWRELKRGNDYFKVAQVPPLVAVCGRKYVFDKQAADPKDRLDANANCPKLKGDDEIEAAVNAKANRDDVAIAQFVAAGTEAVHDVYADGGQNPVFAGQYNDVSRPEALVAGPVEVAIGPKAKKAKTVQLASVASANAGSSTAKSPAPKAAFVQSVAVMPKASVDPDHTIVAKTDAAPDNPKNARPFYAKLFSWGKPTPKASEAAPQAPMNIYEPSVPQPASVPLPPRRAAALTHPKAKEKKTQARLMVQPSKAFSLTALARLEAQ